jgi:hypothetical protein
VDLGYLPIDQARHGFSYCDVLNEDGDDADIDHLVKFDL